MLPSWEETYQNHPTHAVALKKSHLPQESGCPFVLTPTSLLVLSPTSPQGQQGRPESSLTHTHTFCFLSFSSVCLVWGLLGNREQWITKLSFQPFAWLPLVSGEKDPSMQGKPLCPWAPPPSASSLKPQTSKSENCVPGGAGGLAYTITRER